MVKERRNPHQHGVPRRQLAAHQAMTGCNCQRCSPVIRLARFRILQMAGMNNHCSTLLKIQRSRLIWIAYDLYLHCASWGVKMEQFHGIKSLY